MIDQEGCLVEEKVGGGGVRRGIFISRGNLNLDGSAKSILGTLCMAITPKFGINVAEFAQMSPDLPTLIKLLRSRRVIGGCEVFLLLFRS